MTATALRQPEASPGLVGSEPARLALFTDTYVPQSNGVARTLFRLTSALRDRGIDVRVYTTSDPHAFSLPNVRRLPSVPFWAYPELRLAMPTASSLRRDVEHWRPDVVHVATPFGVGRAGRAIASLLSLPLVTSYHTSLAAYAPLYGLGALSEPGWQYLRRFHNAGAVTLVPTMAIASDLSERGFQRLEIWRRGVDLSVFSPGYRSVTLRRQLRADENTTLIGYVGRLAREKRVDVLLDAIRIASPQLDDASFAIVGDGPAGKGYRASAPRAVKFLGRLEGSALSAFYASCDVLVFPSDTDTFGNVLLEAMASGLAIIAADTPVTREVLAEGEAGMFYPAQDSAALAAQIIALASAPSLRRHLARIAFAAASRCSWDGVFDSLLASYSRAIGPSHSSIRARA